MADYGIYGPICDLCHRPFSGHACYLEAAPPEAIEARFPELQVAGIYCIQPDE